MVADPSVLIEAARAAGVPQQSLDAGIPIGLRAPSDVAGAWDDRIVLLRRGTAVPMVATTDPGAVAPRRAEGTAILQPGFYPGLWTKGLHRGKYPAGVQKGPCRLWRDDVSDGRIRRAGPTYTGLFGINLHHGGDSAGPVGSWSEGCQVLRFVADLEFVLPLLPSVFDYLLLDVTGPDLGAWLSAIPRTVPILRRGSFGPDVGVVQAALGIKVDNSFGGNTEAAVKRFQAARGLDADGVVGPQTWTALRAVSPTSG